jgi:hypothetical protein
VGPAKLRSAEITKNRISGRNAKSLWLTRLGHSNLGYENFFTRGRSVYIRVTNPVQKGGKIELTVYRVTLNVL